jgi:hypothetical protein
LIFIQEGDAEIVLNKDNVSQRNRSKVKMLKGTIDLGYSRRSMIMASEARWKVLLTWGDAGCDVRVGSEEGAPFGCGC